MLRELRKAPNPKAELAERRLADVSMLPDLPGLDETAAFYLEHRLLPGGAFADALHLALASMHAVEYLLTWNIRHLANAN